MTRTTKRSAVLLGACVLLLGFFVAPEAAAQCAMCKTTLTNSSEGQRIANNFNHAILVMFFAPYTVFGLFMALVFRDRIRRWLRAHVPAFVRTRPGPALRPAP